MKRRLASTLMILLLLLVATVPTAHAVLQQVGPVNNAPSVGGFPAWYQDTTGLALEFCDPVNAAEVAGGYCLVLPGDVPNPPENFPGEFFDEHFWFAADASLTPANGGRALLVLATEAAFGGGVAAVGDQISFSRIRVRLDPVPLTGTYRFIHPYGEELIEGTLGERIFFSDDVGVAPGVFTGLLTSRLGPFLLPSALPGGTELAPVSNVLIPGKLYIADPGRLGAVTGSPLPNFIACPNSAPCGGGGVSTNHNIFRIEGPAGSNLGGAGIDAIQTTDFSLMGRIFQGAIAGRVNVDRASYEQPVGGPNKVDVFATAFPSTQGRIPPNPTPAVTIPNLVYYDGPCFDPVTGDPAVAGLVSTQMVRTGNRHWGQSAPAVIPQNPAEVCVVQTNVLDAGGLLTSAFFPAPLGDKVNITEALFNPAAGGSLSVRATSMDVVGAPTLHVVAAGEDLGDINPATGQFLVTPFTTPPDKVTVHSSQGGSNEMQVSTGAGVTGPAVGIPAAANDAVTIAEDSGLTTIAVLANDTLDGNPIPPGPPIPTVTIVDAPLLGTAAVVAGTPDPGGILSRINYTPNPNASGTDTFTYQVTVGGIDSNVATVTVTITPVNDGSPTANNDSATVNLNVATPINVLANDTDPDGQADIVAVANLTQPAAGASVALNGTLVNFTATVAGTYTFTYQAQDASAALSNVATVTVTVAAAETLAINKAEYTASTRRYRVEGSIIPFVGQTITLEVLNGPTVLRTDTVVPRAGGAWVIERAGVILPNVPLTVRATSSNGTVATRALVRRP